MEKLEANFFYHIYNRGNNSQNIFFEDINYIYFLKLINIHLVPVCKIYSYCLLPNHFHVLLKINDSCENPSQAFSNLFNAYTKAINKKYSRTGSLFQKPFKRIKITDEAYLKTLVLYIHLNPEKHQISKDFRHYKYSSYPLIVSKYETNIQNKEIIEWFYDLINFKETHKQRQTILNEELLNLILE